MGKVLSVKIKESGQGGAGSFQYKNKVPLSDWRKLALIFSDFRIHGANIDKAFREFKRTQTDEAFPF